MRIVDILKRKDASSVIVAVVVASVAVQAVTGWSHAVSNWLSGYSTAGGWRANFWHPLVELVVDLVVFEILITVYLWLADSQSAKKK